MDSLAQRVRQRLAANKPVRRRLPGDGRLRIERQLPFLYVYRSPPDRADQGTCQLLTTEAAYLIAPGHANYHADLIRLCGTIGKAMQEHFGAFICYEIWSTTALPDPNDQVLPGLQPAFELVIQEGAALPATMEVLIRSLRRIRIAGNSSTVTVESQSEFAPPDLPSLLPAFGNNPGCCAIGIGIEPIYRDQTTGHLYPLVLQSLRQQFAPALRKATLAFTGMAEDDARLGFPSLGPLSICQAAVDVDRDLRSVSESFDLVLQATPVNASEAWKQFQNSRYRRVPQLHYRPLPFDPLLLKRRLYQIELERVEDPTLVHLFAEKQDELARQLNALTDIDTPRFLYDSLMIYGQPDLELSRWADRLLEASREQTSVPATHTMDAERIVSAAWAEISKYRESYSDFAGTVEICDGIASAIMVTQNRLLVAQDARLSRCRLRALMHHEVGTHLLTYTNGRAQRFEQMYAGLAGYESLQEGLAVFAEYLTGGLTPSRIRGLAARVVAVDCMVRGESFLETYRRLHDQYGIRPRSAFTTTLRVFRAGGLTKDMIYLSGLRDLVSYLSNGHEIEPLLVGKIALKHVPFLQDLRRRGIVHAPAVLPRYLANNGVQKKIRCCRDLSLEQLVAGQPKVL
jgi:uncharacterized protein (TIGR02421 family)